MKFYLNNRTAIARALAAGYTVWCAETDEGIQIGRCPSFRYAKREALWFMFLTEGETFYINGR